MSSSLIFCSLFSSAIVNSWISFSGISPLKKAPSLIKEALNSSNLSAIEQFIGSEVEDIKEDIVQETVTDELTEFSSYWIKDRNITNKTYIPKMYGVIEGPIQQMLKSYPNEFTFIRHESKRSLRPSAKDKKLKNSLFNRLKLNKKKHAAEVREALGNIKGPLMKVAQLSATIPDLLPPEYAAELTHLQSNAPPMGCLLYTSPSPRDRG